MVIAWVKTRRWIAAHGCDSEDGFAFLLVLMRTLDRKLLRELWLQGGQTVAIVLIIICGSASFVATGSVYRSLKQTRAAYYERYRFAQRFAQLKRAP
jgi:putative ABC transport system permease protein